MSNTYNFNQMGTMPLFKARRLLGDYGQLVNDAGAQVWLMQDEEINGFIGTDTNNLAQINEGIAQCADALASQFAQEPVQLKDETGTSVDWSERVRNWNRIADQLRKGIMNAVSAVPVAVPLSAATSGPSDLYNLRP